MTKNMKTKKKKVKLDIKQLELNHITWKGISNFSCVEFKILDMCHKKDIGKNESPLDTSNNYIQSLIVLYN